MNRLRFHLEVKLLIVCVFMLHFGSVRIDWKTSKVVLTLSLVDYCCDSDSW